MIELEEYLPISVVLTGLLLIIGFTCFREIKAVEEELRQAELKKQRKKRNRKGKHDSSHYKYLIAIDLEATCWEKRQRNCQEIIEFPAVLINLETGKIEKEFHQYVRPVEIPELSDYCVNLTGIPQETVDAADLLPDVIESFTLWIKETIKKKKLVLAKMKPEDPVGNCIIVTWGNWDILIQLRNETRRKNIRKPSYFNQFMDLKQIFVETYRRMDAFTFADALDQSKLVFEGRPHSGIDDARMTAYLAFKMFKDGAHFRYTKDFNQNRFMNRPF